MLILRPEVQFARTSDTWPMENPVLTQNQNASMDSGGSSSSSSSLSSSNDGMYETDDAVTLADCEGAQPYLF